MANKHNNLSVILIGAMVLIIASMLFYSNTLSNNSKPEKKMNEDYKISKSDSAWKSELSDEQYRVLRQAGTERAYSGEYNLHFEQGEYKCAGCGSLLFDSDSKFESHCGWPSFSDADSNKIIKKIDRSHGMIRTEVLCSNCGGHLGHLFDDGPTPSGLRYCINSASITFSKDSL